MTFNSSYDFKYCNELDTEAIVLCSQTYFI